MVILRAVASVVGGLRDHGRQRTKSNFKMFSLADIEAPLAQPRTQLCNQGWFGTFVNISDRHQPFSLFCGRSIFKILSVGHQAHTL